MTPTTHKLLVILRPGNGGKYAASSPQPAIVYLNLYHNIFNFQKKKSVGHLSVMSLYITHTFGQITKLPVM